VDAVKAEVSAARGSVALAKLLARRGKQSGDPRGQVLRWASHATRNLAVGSRLMQAECAQAGAIEALCVGLQHYCRRESLAAQLHGCKALAYLAKGHEGNRTRAAAAGSLRLAARLLALLSHSVAKGAQQSSSTKATDELFSSSEGSAFAAEAVEAACSVIAFVVERGNGNDDDGDRHGNGERPQKKEGARVAAALHAGCVAVLTQLAADVVYSVGWPQNHKEVIVRWTSVALTAMAHATANTDATQLQNSVCESGSAHGNTSALDNDSIDVRTLLCRELIRSRAKETVAALNAIEWGRQKVREAVGACLEALDRVTRDEDSRRRNLQEVAKQGAPVTVPDTGLGAGRTCALGVPVERHTAGDDAYIYDFRPGLELEAAGRKVTKGFLTLRKDLAALPWVLAGHRDLVVAPPMRPAFRASLLAAGIDPTDIPVSSISHTFSPFIEVDRRNRHSYWLL
jgi:hypothetical protein